MEPVRTNVVGLSGVYVDPLWRVPVRLTAVETDLLRTGPLRRLHFIAHGGASALSTVQSYSRLEHTLGVLALVAHFRPADALLRAAALLHDIGHLPLSHSCEGVAELDHHALGALLLRTSPVQPVLEKHGISPEAVAAVLDGQPPTPLTGRPGLLSLDHLDSYARSGRAAGRLDADPAALLGRLELTDTAVSADRETAASLVDLVCAEAQLHTSWDNVGPVSVVRRLAGQLLASTPLAPAEFARLTDQQLWSALESCRATRAEATMIRYEPHRLRVTAGHAPGDSSGWDFSLRKIYSSAPLVSRQPIESSAPELAAKLGALNSLPTEFRVWWS